MNTDPMEVRWRTGRHLGRTVYAQLGVEPSTGDPLLGLMETEDLAAHVVALHNEGRSATRSEHGDVE